MQLPGLDLVAPNGRFDPLRVVGLFKYSYAINAPAGFGLLIHSTVKCAQVGSCMGVLAGLTRSTKIPILGRFASHGGRIGGVLGISALLWKTVADETMDSFGLDTRSRKLKENSKDQEFTITTLTFTMLGAGAAYSGRKMGALEGGFLGMACGTMFFFASKYMKGVIDREVQKGRQKQNRAPK